MDLKLWIENFSIRFYFSTTNFFRGDSQAFYESTPQNNLNNRVISKFSRGIEGKISFSIGEKQKKKKKPSKNFRGIQRKRNKKALLARPCKEVDFVSIETEYIDMNKGLYQDKFTIASLASFNLSRLEMKVYIVILKLLNFVSQYSRIRTYITF